MPLFLSAMTGLSRCYLPALVLIMGLLTPGCSTPSRGPQLPPSASDLPLLESVRICDQKATFLQTRKGDPATQKPWGTGEEIGFRTNRGSTSAEESYFFDQDGVLVGYFMAFPHGLALDPYPILRGTLAQLKPTVEFYWSLEGLSGRGRPQTTTLFMTGDEKSTTQYLVFGEVDSGYLLAASQSIDPYHQLLSPYRQEFLDRMAERKGSQNTRRAQDADSDKEDPFVALQQFARGETALLAYCHTRNEALATQAYREAIAQGLSTQTLLAEAHHKLGLALKAQGQLTPARIEMEKALEVLPDRPEVLNNLGHVYMELGERQEAIAAFKKAVVLRPNYPLARFNLAEAYEDVNPRLAIEEYETYLALAEGIPGEAQRERRAEERLKALTR